MPFFCNSFGGVKTGSPPHILVVNRALDAKHGDVVVAEVDNDFTVKYLHRRAGRVKLRAADPTFPDIEFRDGQQMLIVGVVTSTIKRFR
ncbi:LexA family protein [Ramlibacter sp.]|uniref:LexA family protein n=1 Tax=Ramlibacter sp. TaxID=1917967 RepID=UPI003D126BF0